MELHILSHPVFFDGEAQVVCDILIRNNCYFHLRKPDANEKHFEHFLQKIPKALLHKIILHNAYALSETHAIGGLHYSTNKRNIASNYTGNYFKSTSCHSIDEIKRIENQYDFCFLSPIFPSISKKGYKVDFNFDEIKNYNLNSRNVKTIALGGIDESKIPYIEQLAFDGIAVLGSIWGDSPNKNTDYIARIKDISRHLDQPYCLSIAGYDPSAGAGVLADIKTFEAHNCYGLGVTTAITYQNDSEFKGVKWLTFEEIEAQIKPLSKYQVKAIKIGLIESFETLTKVLSLLKQLFKDAKIVWDPVLKASAGFNFHETNSLPHEVTEAIDLLTPNYHEFEQLSPNLKTTNCALLLKGGHRPDKPGTDSLYMNASDFTIEGEPFKNKIDKHGTGCVLSSAITAHLAKNENMITACQKGKKYVEQFIESNNQKLGYHKNN